MNQEREHRTSHGAAAVLVAALALAGLPAAADAAPWPMIGQNPRHTGAASGKTVFATTVSKTELYAVGKYGSGGVVVGNEPSGAEVIYGASHDSAFGEAVWAVGRDGKLRWKTPYDAGGGQPGVDVTPYLDGAVLYLAAQDNSVAAFAVDTGKQQWKADLNTIKTLGAGDVYRSSPMADATGNVYVISEPVLGGGEADLFAVGPGGKPAWAYPLGKASSGDGAVAVLGDGSLIVVTTGNLAAVGGFGIGGRVLRLDPKAKQPVWDYRHDKPFPFFGTPAVDVDGSIYFGARSQAAGTDFLMALTSAGKVKWQSTELSSRGSPAIGPKWIYVLDEERDLVALDKATGAEQWRQPVGGGSDPNRAAPVVDACGSVVAASAGGKIVAVSQAGALLWQETFDGAALGSLAVGGDGTVFVRAHGLFAISPSGGAMPTSCPGGGQPQPAADAGVPPVGDAGPVVDSGAIADGPPAGDGKTAEPDAAPAIDGASPAADGAAPAPDGGAATDAGADASGDDGGCACSLVGSSPPTALLLLGLLAVLLARRRR